jgi:hypothetical protein
VNASDAASSTANLYAFFTDAALGTLDPMTGSTQLLGSGQDDVAGPNTPIGFTFNFEALPYNNFTSNSNGLVQLFAGAGAGSTSLANAIAAATGARLRSLPMSPPKVLAAIKAHG